jgi:branched-chain amino acid transport system permease protein
VQFDTFLQTLVNGLFIGGVYGLVSIGLTLIYGVMLILNFAHGEFMMLGMYIAFWAFTWFGLDPYVSVLIAAGLIFLLGAAIQRGLIQRVLTAHPLNQIVLLLGVSTLIIGLVQFFWTADPRAIHVPYETEVIVAGPLRLSIPRMIAFFASLVTSVGLFIFLQYTKTGKAIRAVSQNRDAALLMGIDVKFIYLLTFGLGTAVTAAAGVFLTPTFRILPTVGQAFSVTAFVVVVLGTMGNFIGAFVGGIIIGVVEVFAGYYLGGDVKIIASMIVFILVLLFRPAGLFGRRRA